MTASPLTVTLIEGMKTHSSPSLPSIDPESATVATLDTAGRNRQREHRPGVGINRTGEIGCWYVASRLRASGEHGCHGERRQRRELGHSISPV